MASNSWKRALSYIVAAICMVQAWAAYTHAESEGAGLNKRYIVRFSSKRASAQENSSHAAQKGLKMKSIGGASYTVDSRLSEAELEAELSEFGEVAYVEQDRLRVKTRAATIGYTAEWGVESSGMGRLSKFISEKGAYSDEVVVAVLDTGVWRDHPLLKGRVVDGYDFFSDDAVPDDMDGHGTHVAGIIAQSCGELPVKIMPVRVMDSNGGYDSVIGRGIRYAADNGASVINLSLSGIGRSYYLEEAVKYARQKGAVVVVSAGNDATDAEYYYPAAIRECITVSASDLNDSRADFSNYGACVDVAAPGINIKSSVPYFADHDGIVDGFSYYSGTSMAAPFVSAEAAMLKLENSSRNVSEIEYLLQKRIRDAGPLGRDMLFGYGIIDGNEHVRSPKVNLSQRTELVGGVRTISGRSIFEIKYKAATGYRPPVSLSQDNTSIPCVAEYPSDGIISVRPLEALKEGSLQIKVGSYTYSAAVIPSESVYLFTPLSSIALEFEGKLAGEAQSGSVYIRSPNGTRIDTESSIAASGELILNIEGKALNPWDYGRCSIVLDGVLLSDGSRLYDIMPASMYDEN